METYIENRPWGKFEQFTHNEKTTVKIITVLPKKRLSLQYHHKRKEFWRVIDGNGRLTIGERVYAAEKNQEFTIEKKQKHRMEAGPNGLVILEIAYGIFDENDNVRIEDDFGRA